MSVHHFDSDIDLFCITATSFPEGVKAAHEALHGQIAFSPERYYFGISWMDDAGNLVYKAAASELHPGEFDGLNLEKRTLPKGQYRYIEIKNFMSKIPEIGKAFEVLGKELPIDENNVAVEWYCGEDEVWCMVKMP